MGEQRAVSLRSVFVRTFLWTMVLSVIYFALHHWRVFQDPDWNIPGFLVLAAGMPWSSWWLSYQRELGQLMGWELRNALTVVIVPLGFAVNCAGVITAATGLWRKLRTAYAKDTISNAS